MPELRQATSLNFYRSIVIATMETNETKDLLDFFFHCSDSMQTFWNFYITIVLGLIAFFASTKNPSKSMAGIITIAFVLFAIVNLSGLHDLTNQRFVAAKAILLSLAKFTSGA